MTYNCRVLRHPKFGFFVVRSGSYLRAALAVFARLVRRDENLIESTFVVEVEGQADVRRYRVGVSITEERP
jgi:hypothetical protein